MFFHTFTHYFGYKVGCMSCHDWRPREFNKQADAVCNYVMDDQADINQLDVDAIVSKLASGHMLQVFSDGGFDGSSGVASFVVICVQHGAHTEECIDRTPLATSTTYHTHIV